MQSFDDPAAVLERIDVRLRAAVRLAAEADNALAAADEAGARASLHSPGLALPPVPEGSAVAWLAAGFGLSELELDVVLLGLAAEADPGYERVFAFLQDDVTRRRPSVGLALDLLCATPAARRAARERFAPDATLARHDLLRVSPPPTEPDAPLPAHTLRLDPQIADVLLGVGGLDRRLARVCRVVTAAESASMAGDPDEATARLEAVAAGAIERQLSLHLYLRGTPGSGRERAGAALAAKAGSVLLVANCSVVAAADDAERLLRFAFREARLQGAVLYLDDVDALPEALRRVLGRLLHEDRGVVLMAGRESWPSAGEYPTGTVTVSFPRLSAAGRRERWRTELAAAGLADVDTIEVADRFRLEAGQIAEAAWSVATATVRRDTPPTTEDLFAAARAQSGHALAGLARRMEPRAGWDSLVVPPDAEAQLREICARVRHREQVLGAWGFGAASRRGLATGALFAGPAGTGKTLAAEVIAADLGLDLYVVDLAAVVSKYIGETEKNLDRLFTAAEDADAVLLFDEADTLFGRRSEVRDSHDRYANQEISHLLQRLEDFDGVAILTTNLREHLDPAFVRRLAFLITFPFPDEATRLSLWQVTWPPGTPRAADVDLPALAARFPLSGGHIRNIVLAAAYLAVDAGAGEVTAAHVLHAVRREYQKLGKTLTDADLAPAGGVPCL